MGLDDLVAEGVDAATDILMLGVIHHDDGAALHRQRAQGFGQRRGAQFAGAEQGHTVGYLGHTQGLDGVRGQPLRLQHAIGDVFDDGALRDADLDAGQFGGGRDARLFRGQHAELRELSRGHHRVAHGDDAGLIAVVERQRHRIGDQPIDFARLEQLIALGGGTGRDKLDRHAVRGEHFLLDGHVHWQCIQDRQHRDAQCFRLGLLTAAGGDQRQAKRDKDESTFSEHKLFP